MGMGLNKQVSKKMFEFLKQVESSKLIALFS